jgi:hypothetical protein
MGAYGLFGNTGFIKPKEICMNEVITFTRIYSEIISNLPKMSKIKLLTTWISVSALDKKFPENVYQINTLLKKIEIQIASR